MGRIVLGDACSSEILIHEPIDVRAKEVCPLRFRTGKQIGPWGLMRPPDLERLLHIRGQIDDAIHLAFAAVDPYGARVHINRVPGEGTHFGDPQATAQHAQKKPTISDGINHGKEGSQIGGRYRRGQDGRRQEAMAPPHGLLRHLALVTPVLEEACEEAQFGIDGRRGQPGRVRRGNERHDIVGRRLREVRREHGLPRTGDLAPQRVEHLNHGGQGCAARGPCHEQGQILANALLIRRAEVREGCLIRCCD